MIARHLFGLLAGSAFLGLAVGPRAAGWALIVLGTLAVLSAALAKRRGGY